MVGFKQKKLLSLIKERGFITYSDFRLIYNLPERLTKNKIKEFIAIGWIKIEDDKVFSYKYIKGNDFCNIKWN